MTALETLASAWQDATAVLRDATGLTVEQLCQVGMDARLAKQISKLSEVYFGQTKSTRRQADCVSAAEANKHTLHTLDEIEAFASKVERTDLVWKMRTELCREPANLRQIKARGKELLLEYNGEEQPVNEPKISASAIPGSTYSRLRIDAPGHLVQAALDALKENSGEEHSAIAAAKQLAGAAKGGSTAVTPAVIISLEGAAKLAVGEGDDIVLSLTNGTRMTGADFVASKLTEHGLVMLVDPVEGPVNLYRTSRFPNDKQRMMAKLENPVCAAYGCGVGADYCQINHNEAWKNGGRTNIGDLSTACGFHNGRNDDDRGSPRYGYLDRIGGQIHHVPAFGGPPLLNDHPVALGGAMRIA